MIPEEVTSKYIKPDWMEQTEALETFFGTFQEGESKRYNLLDFEKTFGSFFLEEIKGESWCNAVLVTRRGNELVCVPAQSPHLFIRKDSGRRGWDWRTDYLDHDDKTPYNARQYNVNRDNH